MNRGGIFLLVLSVVCLGEAHADTGWRLCNRSSYIVEAALGRPESEGVKVRGWLRLRPGECREAIPSPLALSDHYVYVRSSSAHRGSRRFWSGSMRYCVGQERRFVTAAVCDSGQEAGFISVPVRRSSGKTTWLREARDYTIKQAQAAGVQRLLNDSGIAQVAVDGRAGLRTRQSIEDFLRRKELSPGISEGDLVDLLEKEARARFVGMELCNRVQERLWTAIAFEREGRWESRGWWLLESGSCVRVLDEVLPDRPYYVYAEMDGSGVGLRGGSRKFCISRSRFVIFGIQDCGDRHYDEADFVETQPSGGDRLLIELTRPDFGLESSG